MSVTRTLTLMGYRMRGWTTATRQVRGVMRTTVPLSLISDKKTLTGMGLEMCATMMMITILFRIYMLVPVPV